MNAQWKVLVVAASFVIVILSSGCGSSSSNGGTTTGTVNLTASVASAANGMVSKDITESATPTAYYVMVYKADISTDATCPSGDTGWTTVYNDTDHTTDCSTAITLEDVQASADYKDIVANPDYGSTSDVPVDTYRCMRVEMCDQLVVAGTTASCPGPYYVLDIYNTQTGGQSDVAETRINYFSTAGTDPTTDPHISGDQDDPFLLGAFDVTSGVVTSLNMQFNIANSLVYDAEDEYPCRVNSPIISFVE